MDVKKKPQDMTFYSGRLYLAKIKDLDGVWVCSTNDGGKTFNDYATDAMPSEEPVDNIDYFYNYFIRNKG